MTSDYRSNNRIQYGERPLAHPAGHGTKGLDLALLLLLLVIGWLWIWGACWNPWRISCFLHPDGHGDPVQHFLGWQAYVLSPPVSLVPPLFDRWTWPEAIPLLFADVIPLAAMLMRPLQQLVGQPFQYFSFFSLVSILATGVLGHRIGWRATQSRSGAFALGLALGLAPPMVLRTTAHEALSLQVLIVSALALLIFRESLFWPWALLLGLAAGVHAYLALSLLPMVAIRLLSQECAPSPLAASLRRALSERLGWKPPARLLEALLLALTFIGACLLLGYASGNVESAPDWGENWSANLLSFFDSANTSPITPPLGRHLPFQSEGFSYLGLFVIIGVPLVHLLGGKRLRATPSLFPSPFLFWGVLALMVVFAWGTRWYVGPHLLLNFDVLKRLPLTAPLYISLRATGRFIWPAYYAITIWTIVHVWTLFRASWWPRLLVLIFVVALFESHQIPLKMAHEQFQYRQQALSVSTDPVPAPLVAFARRPGSHVINITDNPRQALPALPSLALQRLAPGVVTNHAPYLARYPRLLHAAAGATACERMANLLRQHPEIRDRSWFLVEGDGVDSCRPLPGWRVERTLELPPHHQMVRPVPDQSLRPALAPPGSGSPP